MGNLWKDEDEWPCELGCRKHCVAAPHKKLHIFVYRVELLCDAFIGNRIYPKCCDTI